MNWTVALDGKSGVVGVTWAILAHVAFVLLWGELIGSLVPPFVVGLMTWTLLLPATLSIVALDGTPLIYPAAFLFAYFLALVVFRLLPVARGFLHRHAN